jgi:hypothetical protein
MNTVKCIERFLLLEIFDILLIKINKIMWTKLSDGYTTFLS